MLTRAALLVLVCVGAWADFSYDQTSKISKMKAAGASDEIRTSVAVSGDRMVCGDDTRVEIVDLAKETVTVVDFQAQTWQKMTFAEVRDALDEISQKAKEPKGDVKVRVSSHATTPKQVVVTAEITQKSRMTVTVGMTVEDGAGYREAGDFVRRLSGKLDWTPEQNMGIATSVLTMTFGYARARQAAAAIFKEMSKTEGLPVRTEIRMTDNQPVFEMTSEVGNASAAAVDPARFQVPAGFEKTTHDLRWLMP